MTLPRRVYWWLIRRLPPGQARALRAAVIYAASGGRRRAFPPKVTTSVNFTPPKLKLLCMAWEVSEEELAGIVQRVLDAVGDPTRVACVSDSDAVHLFRKTGCRVEYVPPRTDWESHFPERDYESFVRHRIDALFRIYEVERTVTFGAVPDGLLWSLVGKPSEPAEAVDLSDRAVAASPQ